MSAGLAARLSMAAADQVYRRPFKRSAANLRATQERTLNRILRENAQTEFGRAHGFERLSFRDGFRRAVPVSDFDDLSAAIQSQAETGAQTLTAAPPVFYARTSGTTGPARDIPLTQRDLSAYRTAQRIFATTLYHDTGFFEGRIAGFGGTHIEGTLPSGQPFGSASGQTYATAPRFVREKFVTPEAAFSIADADTKYSVYALSALATDDLSGMITANPSTLVTLMAHIQRNAGALLDRLATGSGGSFGVKASLERIRAVERALDKDRLIDALWPRLRAIAAWTGGNCRVALGQLMPLLHEETKVVEVGYRSSEFIGTINVDAANNLCLPNLGHVVFEFVEESRWEAGEDAFKWLDELEPGGRYYIFATTASGLFRYNINDVVEVGDTYRSCPSLKFVRKGQGVTSITGEKVSENQAIDAAQSALLGAGLAPSFYIVVADPARARYRLCLETATPLEDREALAAGFDAKLRAENIEYASKRASDRLEPAEVVFLKPGVSDAIRSAALSTGKREAQLKLPALVDKANWPFDIRQYTWDSRA